MKRRTTKRPASVPTDRAALVAETARALAETLRAHARVVKQILDPDGHVVHDACEIELALPALTLRAGTGWETFLLVTEVRGARGLREGDRLEATDWIVDNYGPEGIVLAFDGARFVAGHGEAKVEDAAVQARAAAFGEGLIAATGAPKLVTLIEALWWLTPAASSALWRMRNLARVTFDPAEYRGWGVAG